MPAREEDRPCRIVRKEGKGSSRRKERRNGMERQVHTPQQERQEGSSMHGRCADGGEGNGGRYAGMEGTWGCSCPDTTITKTPLQEWKEHRRTVLSTPRRHSNDNCRVLVRPNCTDSSIHAPQRHRIRLLRTNRPTNNQPPRAARFIPPLLTPPDYCIAGCLSREIQLYPVQHKLSEGA